MWYCDLTWELWFWNWDLSWKLSETDLELGRKLVLGLTTELGAWFKKWTGSEASEMDQNKQLWKGL